MSYAVLIQPRANEDIIRNSMWWADQHSVEEALRWQDAIYNRIRALADNADACALAYEDSDFDYELREALFGLGSRPGYRILFTVVEQTVHVLCVKAAQEDWFRPKELPESAPEDESV